MNGDQLLELWKELRTDTRVGAPQVRRRLAPDAKIDLFAYHSFDRDVPGILLEAVSQRKFSTIVFPACRGLSVEAREVKTPSGWRSSMFVWLEDPALRSEFSALCADIVAVVLELADVETAYSQGINRLVRWLTMFDRLKRGGLSREQRLGLFGEMHVLLLLMTMVSPVAAAEAWQGWDAQHQDFRLGDVGLEVKASTAKRHARIYISNEKQLDDSLWRRLLLGVIWVDVDVADGTTLPEIIGLVRDRLEEFPSARLDLNLHLLEAGYSDTDGHLYERETYLVRNEAFFEVRDHFPRLTEANLSQGVGDISYSILVAGLSEFEVDPDQLTKIFTGDVN